MWYLAKGQLISPPESSLSNYKEIPPLGDLGFSNLPSTQLSNIVLSQSTCLKKSQDHSLD